MRRVEPGAHGSGSVAGFVGVQSFGIVLAALGEDASIVNNTVIDNVADAGASNDIGGIRIDGECDWDIANNILWNNTGIDLALNVEGVALRNNDIAELGGSKDPQTNSGNLSVDPQFVSATSPRRKRSSALIDAGPNATVGGLPGAIGPQALRHARRERHASGKKDQPGRIATLSTPSRWCANSS